VARRRFSDAQRRARLVQRHHLGRSGGSPLEITRDLVVLHSTDPTTPYLSLWARGVGFDVEALEATLYEDRALWRLHAMRRTLFIVAKDEAPVLLAAATADIAGKERKRVAKWLADAMPSRKLAKWWPAVEGEILEALAGGETMRTRELAESIEAMQVEVTLGSGKWAQRSPIGSRLLFLLAMDGVITRGRPAGSWRSSQYQWADSRRWFGEVAAPLDPREARARLIRRYLERFGPATTVDVKWWTGWTVAKVKAALSDAEAVEVALESGAGWVASGDERAARASARVTLLPALDGTPMGYKERAWFLGKHEAALFDRNGNIGPTIWLGGRIVGGWAVRPDGEVTTRLLEDVGTTAARKVTAEAAALTRWLDGTPVSPRFPTPLERELRAG